VSNIIFIQRLHDRCRWSLDAAVSEVKHGVPPKAVKPFDGMWRRHRTPRNAWPSASGDQWFCRSPASVRRPSRQ